MFTRNCPQCGNEISYSSKQTLSCAISKNRNCRSCAVKIEYKKNPDKNKGNNNGMFGNNLKDAMINKYGKDIAEEKYTNWKSIKCTFKRGNLNPQYGNPPFENGGRSYHGWYNNIFFRSSFELIFLIENSGLDLTPADNKDFRVEYFNNNKSHFYYPDFYSKKTNTVYEIKSFQWLNKSPNNIKIDQAKKYFAEKNIKYVTVTEKDLEYLNQSIGSKYQMGKLIFLLLYKKFIDREIKLTGPSIERMEKRLGKQKEFLKLEKMKTIKNEMQISKWDLFKKLKECKQTETQNVLEHGISVKNYLFDLISHLEFGSPLKYEWKLPDWILDNKDLIINSLPSKKTLKLYTILHDIGKPFCLTIDVEGKRHFPDHAEASYNTFINHFEDNAAADLIRRDMDIHLLKSEGVEDFCKNPNAIASLITGLAEIHSNAKMFGGIESTSFKIKWKCISKRGKQIIQTIKNNETI